MLSCPTCRVPVGDSNPPRAVVDVVCSKCTYAYRFLFGTVEKRSSRQVTLQRQSTKHAGQYQREYEFRLRTPDGGLESVAFTVDGRDDWILARQRDEVSFVYTLKSGSVEEMLTVLNLTTGESYVLASAGSKARRNAAIFGGVVAALVLVVAWFNSSFGIAALLAAASGVGGFVLVLRATTPKQKLTPEIDAAVSHQQGLLEKKRDIILAGKPVFAALERHRELLERLEGLRGKMEAVGAEMYRSRIERMVAAMAILERQIAVEEEIITVTVRMAKMVEIEIESHGTAGALSDSVSDALAAPTAELATLRQRNDELETNLLANEEVEGLLKAG